MTPTAVAGPEHRFELLINSAIDYAIYMLNPDGNISSWNSGAEKMKGYTAEEVIGRHFSLFYTAQDIIAGLPAKVLDVATRDGRFHDEVWQLCKDGSRFRALIAITAIRDDDGRLLGFAKLTRDITQRQQAEARLAESEQRFQLLVEGLPDHAMCMLDASSHITHWNNGARRLCGYETEEVIGKPLAMLLSPNEREQALTRHIFDEAAARGLYQGDHWHQRQDGTNFPTRLIVRPLHEPGNSHSPIGFAYILRDLSEQRATERELEATREQWLHAQKLEALGQLIGGIAHDFNNILQAITGALEMTQLSHERANLPDAAHYVQSAQQSVTRAATLTRRLLAFARRQPLSPRLVDVNALALSMQEMLDRTLGSNIRFRLDLEAGPLHVLCDAGQLESVLLNLVINGRDAMPGGGQLTISTCRMESVVVDQPPGDYIRLRVANTGIGISAQIASRIFNPFFNTKSLGQGTGLGSIILGFVQQSKGFVRTNSVPGQGTYVDLCLPACSPGA